MTSEQTGRQTIFGKPVQGSATANSKAGSFSGSASIRTLAISRDFAIRLRSSAFIDEELLLRLAPFLAPLLAKARLSLRESELSFAVCSACPAPGLVRIQPHAVLGLA